SGGAASGYEAPVTVGRAIVRRALIPCGGRGTRMAHLTRGDPKELLSVAGVPAVERVARECAASGIDELLVVIAPDKQAIREHLTPLTGRDGMPRSIAFAVQREPLGLADALRLGRAFAGGAPLAVALPDNLFVDADPGLAQVIETFMARGLTTVAVVEIHAGDASRRGPTAVLEGALDGDVFRIARFPGKGERTHFDTGGRPSAFTNVGRYAFTPELFDAIDAVERTLAAGTELDDVPVLQRLLSRGRLIGRRMRGRFL